MARAKGGPVVARVGPSFTLYTLLRTHIEDVRAAGFDVLCICDEDEWSNELRARGVTVVPIGMGRRPRTLAVVVWALRLFRYLRAERVDVIHTSNAFHGLAARLVGRCARVPVVVHTVHNWFFLQPGARWGRAYAFLERVGGLLADAVFFVGVDDLETAEARRLVPRRKRIFIGDGVDIDGFTRSTSEVTRAQARKSVGFDLDAEVVAMVARTEPPKDHELLLDAFDLLASARPRLRLLLVGGGMRFREVEDRITRSPFAGRITALGHRTDVPELLRAVDVLVLTSSYEAFGRSLVEGMLAGVPVIGCDVPGIRHVIAHQETGILVRYGDPDQLAASVGALLSDGELASRLATAALRTVNRFDEAEVSKRVCDAYRQLLSASPRRRRSDGGRPGRSVTPLPEPQTGTAYDATCRHGGLGVE